MTLEASLVVAGSTVAVVVIWVQYELISWRCGKQFSTEAKQRILSCKWQAATIIVSGNKYNNNKNESSFVKHNPTINLKAIT